MLLAFFIPSRACINYVQTMKRLDNIYLDHAAGTFLLPEVHARLNEWIRSRTSNPSSIHAQGRQAAADLNAAREAIASVIGGKPGEILFTSGGTEANNLGIIGAARALKDKGNHIITCQTEHPSALESCKQLEQEGFRVSYLPCDTHGVIDPLDLQQSIDSETILVSLMWVNNETGLIHPMEQIGEIIKAKGVRLHVDAIQAIGHLSLQVDSFPADSISFSGHKLGAPAGIGALYLKKGQPLQQLSFGGSQELNYRAGTQNQMGAQALGAALQYWRTHADEHAQHYETLQDRLIHRLSDLPGIQINRGEGPYTPHILNCSFHNIDGEALFIRLDMKHIAVSNGSACSSGSQAPSHVLTAMGFDEKLAQASLRISLGIQTNQNEIDGFCDELELIVHSLYKEPQS